MVVDTLGNAHCARTHRGTGSRKIRRISVDHAQRVGVGASSLPRCKAQERIGRTSSRHIGHSGEAYRAIRGIGRVEPHSESGSITDR